jgi:hypothetical protein
MITLGIDPGLKPGYAIVEDGKVTWTGTSAPLSVYVDRVITEDIWFGQKGKGASDKTVSKISFHCGWQVSRFDYAPVYRLEVKHWKDVHIYNGVRMPKSTFISRLRRKLGLGPGPSGDEVEAAGLALCGVLCNAKTLRQVPP